MILSGLFLEFRISLNLINFERERRQQNGILIQFKFFLKFTHVTMGVTKQSVVSNPPYSCVFTWREATNSYLGKVISFPDAISTLSKMYGLVKLSTNRFPILHLGWREFCPSGIMIEMPYHCWYICIPRFSDGFAIVHGLQHC